MKVISVTPAGRKRYLEILVPYLLNNREYITEHHFWLNTLDKEDVDYIESLAKDYPNFFKINRRKIYDNIWTGIWQYYKDYTDKNTIYIKLDDDICYIEKDAIKNLISCRIKNPNPFMVYGNIVNNAICSYFQQKRGKIPLNWGRISYNHVDELGCKNAKFAERLHKRFIVDIKEDKTEKWKMKDIIIKNYEIFSINVMCWFGEDMKGIKEINQKLGRDEEFFSHVIPKRLDRPNIICGNALFGHFAFYLQRKNLEKNTWLIEEYRLISIGRRTGKLEGKIKNLSKNIGSKLKKHYFHKDIERVIGEIGYLANRISPRLHNFLKKV